MQPPKKDLRANQLHAEILASKEDAISSYRRQVVPDRSLVYARKINKAFDSHAFVSCTQSPVNLCQELQICTVASVIKVIGTLLQGASSGTL